MILFSKSKTDLDSLVKLLKAGQVVAGPTETAYGLLADAFNRRAVAKIFSIKKRPPQKPCPVAVANLNMARQLSSFNQLAYKLAANFWPGALTLVLPIKKGFWPQILLANTSQIGLRVPGSVWLRQLVKKLGRPITVTSANLSDRPALYDYQSVISELSGQGLKYVVKARCLRKRPVSTVVEVGDGNYRIVRPGAVSESAIKSVLRYN